MLREPASSPKFLPQPLPTPALEMPTASPEVTIIDNLRDVVEPYLSIAKEYQSIVEDLTSEDQAIVLRGDGDLVVTFAGYLKQEGEQVYDALDQALQAYDCYALLREYSSQVDAPHHIHIIDGRLPEPQPSRIGLNILLFVLTVFSVFFTGAQQALLAAGQTFDGTFNQMLMGTFGELWRGYPYALSVMAILIAHEMGHYLMMRRHGLDSSLPYFIPAWLISPFGTFGAAIVLRDVLKNRRVLLDVGAAGPIAGFIVAVPLVIYGLSTSPIVPLSAGTIEGNSLIYLFAKIIALGQIYPTAEADVLINQVAFAGWTGLFVTTLNMIPLGQLDGGHVMYALFGNRARWAFYPVMMALVTVSIVTGQSAWVFFLLVLVFIGRFYAVPLDTITPLDQPRRVVAFSALVIFILTFTPAPFYTLDPDTLNAQTSLQLSSMMLVIGLCVVPRWLRWRL
ncbi:MAG: site-2 protease family protein [Anaerolineae bacterium]